MSICLINESGPIFGNTLVSREWKKILLRKEYAKYRVNAAIILKKCDEAKIYCPNISIKDNILYIEFTVDNRYIVFRVSPMSTSYCIGTKEKENYEYNWDNKYNMTNLSNYLYGTKECKSN